MSNPNVKNLECLCVKNTSVTTSASGGVFKARINGISSFRSSSSYGYGKISSTKTVEDKEFRYRVNAPVGTALKPDTEGPIYKIYILPSQDWETPPRTGDNIVLSGHNYTVVKYHNEFISNGFKVRELEIEAPLGSPSPFDSCSSELGYTCLGIIQYTFQSNPIMTPCRGVKSKLLIGVADVEKSKLSATANIKGSMEGVAAIHSGVMTADYSLNQGVEGVGVLDPTFLDKLRGNFGEYTCLEKLYPNSDLPIDPSMDNFVGPENQSTNLYTFIDEGVTIGDDYHIHLGQGSVVSDDSGTWITPDSIHTEGLFQYKSELTDFHIRPDTSRLRIRASAPMSNYESKIPPLYTIENITFSDPSGNVMVKYEDIDILGDVDYNNQGTHVNYATYSLAPIVNEFTDKYDWQRREFPYTDETTGYALSFDVRVTPRDDAFDFGFADGFEEDHITNLSFSNPTNGLRISAIEICNSGGDWLSNLTGPRREDYFKLFLDVPNKGRRLEKKILPSFFALADTSNSGIFPSVSSVWNHKNSISSVLGNNLDLCGSQQIVKALQVDNTLDYAELHSTGPHLDSGKIIMKFSYGHGEVNEIVKGAFNCAFDQSTCSGWYHPSGAFSTEAKSIAGFDNNFLTIESITLKVKAKKAVGSRDYSLDVVGWSDDRLLNVTKAPSGFLQSPSKILVNDQAYLAQGSHPSVSGYADNDNDLSMSATSISEKEKYLETSGNLGGDHYSLMNYPVINTTDWADYEIPLKIYKDAVELGLSRNYSVSSMLENLYLDIYPLPSGASIASAHLLVRYAPQVALKLDITGGECYTKISDERSEGKLFPTTRQSNDEILNAGSGYAPLSTITNIPNTYSTPSSIKTNYARRWRGMKGVVGGSFDPDMFGFGFENPLVEYPFINGFYNFNNIKNGFFVSEVQGLGSSEVEFNLTSNLYSSVYNNVGWRFTSGNLFTNELEGYSGNYQTSDWTSLSGGVDMSTTFQGNPMYGRIADAFNTIVRVSGRSGGQFLDMQPDSTIDTSGGFSIFLRFTPDATVSGVGYDLFDSGVLVSKWQTPNDLDFALGYKDGKLAAYAKDIDDNVITIQDDVMFSGYQYPLSVILTYNDHDSSGLKLYTDNEAYEGQWNTLRASSSPFRKHRNDSADAEGIQVGWCEGSGVGFNMLVSEFGISTYSSGVDTMFGHGTNIVESNPDLTYKQVTAQSFLEGHRAKFFQPQEASGNDSYKLPSYVDEDPQDWRIGDFRSMAFGAGFSKITKRSGRDLINFYLRDSGVPYENKLTIHQDTWPSTVSSGVCYHTQIENDFLRFHLSDTSDNFYSVHKRITKNLPIGYDFKEKAMVVETILEHRSSGDITWPECQPTTFDVCSENRHAHQDHFSGPRLIVSLYTKKKEPYWNPNEDNWGLVNRAIHYVQQSSGIVKLESKFNHTNLADESEKWALFPSEPRLSEFNEKYYSQDVDDMFLQYDLVYPSGGQFESKIDVHTAHVRMDDALIKCTSDSGVLNLVSSGGLMTDVRDFKLFTEGLQPTDSGLLNLHTFGPLLLPSSGFELNISGGLRQDESLPLRTVAIGIADSSWDSSYGAPLHLNGCCNVVSGVSGTFNLTTIGKGVSSLQMPLSVTNDGLVYTPSGGQLPLFTYAPSGNSQGFWQQLQLRMENNLSGGAAAESGSMSVFVLGSSPLVDISPEVSMPLVIMNQQFVSSGSLNLVIKDDGITSRIDSSGSGVNSSDSDASQIGMNLYIPNYGGVGSSYLRWYNLNYGTGIQLRDNAFSALDADNEIRGVDLIGYGACDSDSPRKAIDPPLVTDETVWRPETCNDGGIFRAIQTYTNSGAINFAGETGYSGNYYGFRKYTGLIPHAPYFSTLKITTGSTDPIKVPRNFEEWEYGTCGPNWRGDDGDCDTDIVYSGVKLIGDYPYMSGDLSITPESGRNVSDNYGERVATTDNLMVISSPKMEVPDASGHAIPDAGSLMLYRRSSDVAGEKAAWTMEDKLMLPSGFRRDYVSKVIDNLIQFDQFVISGQQWKIGQEGRLLGSSLDVGVSGDRETIVAGAPFAKWSREFEDIQSSGIPACMMVFVDKFSYEDSKIKSIGDAGTKWERLYKYFSAPWNAGTVNEFQPSLDVKVIVFQLAFQDEDKPKQPEKYKEFFRHHYIPRMDDQDLIESFGERNTFNSMYSGILAGFEDMFPVKTSWLDFQPHSGIPPIVGIFKEESHSTMFGGAFQTQDNNSDVVDDFISHYGDYSYRSGVINPEIPVAVTGHLKLEADKSEDWASTTIRLLNNTLSSGYLLTTNLESTNYPVMSVITSGVGQEFAKDNATDFQIPPPSGGRVYIFEKESGVFNCVQEIVSYSERDFNTGDPTSPDGEYMGWSREYNDRFGHSVAISKDTSIISVGSPFTYVPCEIFERQDSENTRMYNNVSGWLNYRNLSIPLNRYIELFADSGKEVAQKQVYHELSHTNKFWLRNDENFWSSDAPTGGQGKIELYKPIYNYKYSDITSTGTWKFIQEEFLGSSRLGYSTSVSDDGKTVAFGAPTDSTNMFEDTNVWYNRGSRESTWASYTNAGAVRIFESKEMVAHSSVVEFTRFGNLDRSVHSVEREAGYYDRMQNYFNPVNIPFRRTEFSELEIPTDAGLAFIVTPEIDAASDEVIENIKDWLALGDRTLVLVGNDPLYEENGLYRESNDIINKILNKLGSRMRITHADTKYEALVGEGNLYQDQDGCVNESNVFADKFNVTKSFVPKYAHTETFDSPILAPNMFAKGVGKIVLDISDLSLDDHIEHAPCDELNADVCGLPSKHLGDLRSQWNSECDGVTTSLKIKYKTNWPFHFGNPNPATNCNDYPEEPKPLINRPYEDVVPILTAAEWLPDQVWYRDEFTYCWEECTPHYEYYTIPNSFKVCEFEPHQLDEIAFAVSGDNNESILGKNFDYFNHIENKGGFIDPEAENGRDGILKGVGNVREDVDIIEKEVKLSDTSPLMVEEPYFFTDENGNTVDGNNRVFILASVLGENIKSFTDGGDDPTMIGGNDDQNLAFYANLLKRDCNEASRVVQLGGWTKRTSFKDAYEHSVLKSKLTKFGFDITENGVYNAGSDIDATEVVDTVWIANPNGVPTNQDVQILKNWLSNKNKNLIITYDGSDEDNRQFYAQNVSTILEKLGLGTRPWSRPCKGDYFVVEQTKEDEHIVKNGNEQDCCPYDGVLPPIQKVNGTSDIFEGCANGYGWNSNYNDQDKTSVQKVSLRAILPTDAGDRSGSKTLYDFIPISGADNATSLIHYEHEVEDLCPEANDNIWFLDCVGSGQFSVSPGSGYRIFVNWVSENKNEIYGINGYLDNALDVNNPCENTEAQKETPCDCFETENLVGRYTPLRGDAFSGGFGNGLLGATTVANPEQISIDVKADSTGKLRVLFDTQLYKNRIDGHDPANGLPQTPRILSISGCPLPINEIVVNDPITKKKTTWICEEKCETVPASSGVIPGEFRPIKHKSSEYCDPRDNDCSPRGENEIQDGPILAAEEFEHFSAGINGFRRSKIVLLSDSTMIQGQCEHYRNDSVGENQQFIRSLYPVSPHNRDSSDLGFQFDVTGSSRQFQFVQKLRAPERGSAGKYYAAKGVDNTVPPMFGNGATSDVTRYVDNEDTYNPSNPGFTRPADPLTPLEFEEEIKKFGDEKIPLYGPFPRFSGDFLDQLPANYVIDGKERDYIADAGKEGGINDLMKISDGKDFLDFDHYNSGCAGDLFGWSVDISNNKLVVGTPFNGFVTENVASGISGIVQWHEIQNDDSRSGVVVSQNGGAGSAFYFERTNSGTNVVSERLPWEFKQKIKPSSVNVGLDGASVSELQFINGDHNLSPEFIYNHAGRTDKFGYSVAIDADMIAVGAPHHDFETLHDHIYSGSTAFQRKSFNAEFDIPLHTFHDLGSSGVRIDKFNSLSGTMVLNQGAVFNYRHSMVDWQNREKQWTFAEKLVSHGHHARSGSVFVGSNLTSSGCENDSFGRSVSIFRSERGDSDYTLVVGAPFHDHPTSGDHISSGVQDAGAAYTYDAMLREQTPEIANSGSWIDVKIFGAKTENGLNMLRNRVYQNTQGEPESYLVSGYVYANQYGDLYIEASGFDPSVKGFIAHRPFVESLIGDYVGGDANSGIMPLITTGKAVDLNQSMNLMLSGEPSAIVYNNMSFRTFGASGVPSGDMILYVTAPSGSNNESLNLNVSSTKTTENLNLRLRGK